jgi:predicted site-specific integrase-resolvase
LNVSELGKAIDEAMARLNLVITELIEIVVTHEDKLQRLDNNTLKSELAAMAYKINAIADQTKKQVAMEKLAILCDTLGIEDLELAGA